MVNIYNLEHQTRRTLFVAIMSTDDAADSSLQELLHDTRALAHKQGLDTEYWPEVANDAPPQWHGPGKEHLALVTGHESDLLLGVASRRASNVPRGYPTDNWATNQIINVLDPHDGKQNSSYGRVIVNDRDRLWRDDQFGSVVEKRLKDLGIVLTSRDGDADLRNFGASIETGFNRRMADHNAAKFIEAGVRRKTDGHERGEPHVARAAIHPAVRLDQWGRYTWNEEVAAAFGLAAELYLRNVPMSEIARRVASSIPSYQFRAEPDFSFDQNGVLRSFCRAGRNAVRAQRGVPEVPLKLNTDGSPNPAYRGETLEDTIDPVGALWRLLTGPEPPPRGGAHERRRELPDDYHRFSYLDLLSTGNYVRYSTNLDGRQRTSRVYRKSEFQMPPLPDGTYPISLAAAAKIRKPKGKRGRRGGSKVAALVSFEFPDDSYTREGPIPTSEWRAALHSNTDRRVYQARAVRHGERRKPAGERVLATIRADDLHAQLANAITAACEHPDDFIEIVPTDREANARDLRQSTLAQAVTEADRLFRNAMTTYVTLDADHPLKNHSLEEATRLKKASEVASDELARFTAERPAPNVESVSLLDDRLHEVVALLRAPDANGDSSRRLREYLESALGRPGPESGGIRVSLHPESSSLRWTACMTLPGDNAVVRLKLAGELPNDTKEPWFGKLPGRWWSAPEPVVGKAHNADIAEIARRLVKEAAENGLTFRSPHHAVAIPRCPNPDFVRIAFGLSTGASLGTEEQRSTVKELLFGEEVELERFVGWQATEFAQALARFEALAATDPDAEV